MNKPIKREQRELAHFAEREVSRMIIQQEDGAEVVDEYNYYSMTVIYHSVALN